eukprot:Blabericola_migrator_1__394@NODE_109_length_14038_cov_78_087968_g97_i0_p1_GENE_NODE_109_length_14038_cov_78_087968_g97_i0NODE_109_length_14038_cov_78_087968_g97_i0_p1_ORF_typecomplete_len2516_score431_14VPS13_C/PF16909_5/0_0085SHRBD/PF06650_12/1_4e03SHRBD/PF06650_12/0_036_NODE_109_length_14038_cov_78_087968_g97_i0535812905
MRGLRLAQLRLVLPVTRVREKIYLEADNITFKWQAGKVVVRISQFRLTNWAEAILSQRQSPPPTRWLQWIQRVLRAIGELWLSAVVFQILILYSFHPKLITQLFLYTLASIDLQVDQSHAYYGFHTVKRGLQHPHALQLTTGSFYCLSKSATVHVATILATLDSRPLMSEALSAVQIRLKRTLKRFDLSLTIQNDSTFDIALWPEAVRILCQGCVEPLLSPAPPVIIVPSPEPQSRWSRFRVWYSTALAMLSDITVVFTFVARRLELSQAITTCVDVSCDIAQLIVRVAYPDTAGAKLTATGLTAVYSLEDQRGRVSAGIEGQLLGATGCVAAELSITAPSLNAAEIIVTSNALGVSLQNVHVCVGPPHAVQSLLEAAFLAEAVEAAIGARSQTSIGLIFITAVEVILEAGPGFSGLVLEQLEVTTDTGDLDTPHTHHKCTVHRLHTRATKPNLPALDLQELCLSFATQDILESLLSFKELRVSVGPDAIEILSDTLEELPRDPWADCAPDSPEDDASMASAWSSPPVSHHSPARLYLAWSRALTAHTHTHPEPMVAIVAERCTVSLTRFNKLTSGAGAPFERPTRVSMECDLVALYPDTHVGRYSAFLKARQAKCPLEVTKEGALLLDLSSHFVKLRVFQMMTRLQQMRDALNEFQNFKLASRYAILLDHFAETGEVGSPLVARPASVWHFSRVYGAVSCHLINLIVSENDSERLTTLTGSQIEISDFAARFSAQDVLISPERFLLPHQLLFSVSIAGAQSHASPDTQFELAMNSSAQFSIKVENGFALLNLIIRDDFALKASEEHVLRAYNAVQTQMHPVTCAPSHWKLYGVGHHCVQVQLAATMVTLKLPVNRYKPFELTVLANEDLRCRLPSVDLMSAMLSMNERSSSGEGQWPDLMCESVVNIRLVKGCRLDLADRLAHLEGLRFEFSSLSLEGLVDRSGVCQYKATLQDGLCEGQVHVQPTDETDAPNYATLLRNSRGQLEIRGNLFDKLDISIHCLATAILVPPPPKALELLSSQSFSAPSALKLDHFLNRLSLQLNDLQLILLADSSVATKYGCACVKAHTMHYIHMPTEGVLEVSDMQIYLGTNKVSDKRILPPLEKDYDPLSVLGSRDIVVWSTHKLGEKPGYQISPLLEQPTTFRLHRACTLIDIELGGEEVKVTFLLKDWHPIQCFIADFKAAMQYAPVFQGFSAVETLSDSDLVYESPPKMHAPGESDTPSHTPDTYRLILKRFKFAVSLLNATGLKTIMQLTGDMPLVDISYAVETQKAALETLLDHCDLNLIYGSSPTSLLATKNVALEIVQDAERGTFSLSASRLHGVLPEVSQWQHLKQLLREALEEEFQVYYTLRPPCDANMPVAIDSMAIEGKVALCDGRGCRCILQEAGGIESDWAWLEGPPLADQAAAAPSALLKKEEIQLWCPPCTALIRSPLPDKFAYRFHQRVKNKTDAILIVGTTRGRGKPADVYMLDPGDHASIQEIDSLYVEILGYQGQAARVKFDQRFMEEPASRLLTFAKPGQRDQLIVRVIETPLHDAVEDAQSLVTVRFEPLVKIRNALPWRLDLRFESGDVVVIKPSSTVRPTLTSLRTVEVRSHEDEWVELMGTTSQQVRVTNAQGISCVCNVIQHRTEDLQRWILFTAACCLRNGSTVPLAIQPFAEKSIEDETPIITPQDMDPPSTGAHSLLTSLTPVILPTEFFEAPSIDTPIPTRFIADDVSYVMFEGLTAEQVLSPPPPPSVGNATLGDKAQLIALSDLNPSRDVVLGVKKAVRVTMEEATKWKCRSMTIYDPIVVHNQTSMDLLFTLEDKVIKVESDQSQSVPLSLDDDMCQFTVGEDSTELITLQNTPRQFVVAPLAVEKGFSHYYGGEQVDIVKSQTHLRIRRQRRRYHCDVYIEHSSATLHHRERFSSCLDAEQYIIFYSQCNIPIFVSVNTDTYIQVEARGSASLWSRKDVELMMNFAVATDHKAAIAEAFEESLAAGTTDCYVAPSPLVLQKTVQLRILPKGVYHEKSHDQWVRLPGTNTRRHFGFRQLAASNAFNRLRELQEGSVDCVLMRFHVTASRAGRVIIVTISCEHLSQSRETSSAVSTQTFKHASKVSLPGVRLLSAEGFPYQSRRATPMASLVSTGGSDTRSDAGKHPWTEGRAASQDSLLPLSKHQPPSNEYVPKQDATTPWTGSVKLARLVISSTVPDSPTVTLMFKKVDLSGVAELWRRVHLNTSFAKVNCILTHPSSFKVIASVGSGEISPVRAQRSPPPTPPHRITSPDIAFSCLLIAEKYVLLQDMEVVHVREMRMGIKPITLSLDVNDIQSLTAWREHFVSKLPTTETQGLALPQHEEWNSDMASVEYSTAETGDEIDAFGYIQSLLESAIFRIDQLSLSKVSVNLKLKTTNNIETSPQLNFPPFERSHIFGLNEFIEDVVRKHFVAGVAKQWHKSVLSLQIAGFSPSLIASLGDKLLSALDTDGQTDDVLGFADPTNGANGPTSFFEDSPAAPLVRTLSQLRSLIKHINHQQPNG